MGNGMSVDPGVTLPTGPSELEKKAQYLAAGRDAHIDEIDDKVVESLFGSWNCHARAAQRPPDGDWQTWLILAGRGFGKTRAGAEWVHQQAMIFAGTRIALIAATLAEARAIMVEGETGLLAIGPPSERPKFEASNRRLIWPNKTQAFLYSAGEPESLRGPQHHFAWVDEAAKWPRAREVWDNLAMGLRLGSKPQTVVTSTPRAVPLIRALVAAATADGLIRMTGGRMIDNRAHLAEGFIERMEREYAGTVFGRQELEGALIEEIEGALWSRALIERCRAAAHPLLVRVVIGVDPPAGADASSDACGIVVVGLGEDGRAYVLADASVQGASPESWAQAVAMAAEVHRADRVVAEANNGGAMVESVLRAADAALPVRRVHAAHGKVTRAEPVQALYAAGKAFHVGAFPELEDEMAGLMAGGAYEGPGRSPDRADALVWAMHELMLGKRAPRPGVRTL